MKLLILVPILLAGCASPNEIRITEYKGTAKSGIMGVPYVKGDLDIKGCRITQKGTIQGTVEFQGDICRMQVKPKKPPKSSIVY